ncbi:gamma-glutamyltransferase, partial [Luteimonas sp. TWI662]|uniref:gamma-glutamyltransferase n=1 Tax=Luteimonas sp. TWI662 TaxID=3136789 RepID=UPI0032080F25
MSRFRVSAAGLPVLLLSLLLLAVAPSCARDVRPQSAPVAAQSQATPPGNAVASAHALATEAGLQVMREGGNAFDAAIATSAVLSVVEPISSGLGGGGFFLLHDAASGRDVFIDARETAPASAHPDRYRTADGQFDRDRAENGPWSAGIPGLPAAFVHIAERYGRLPLAQSLAPARPLAPAGIPGKYPV